MKDAHDTADEDKVYDFLSSETFSDAASGSTPTIRKLRPQDHNLSGTFYALNTQRSEIENIQGSGTNRYATAKKEIASDGSTVINVYFDRKTVTYNFYNTTSNRNLTAGNLYMTLQGLYGQTFAEASKATGKTIAWPAAPSSGRIRYMWRDANIWTGGITYLNGFYASDLNRLTVNLYKLQGSNYVVQQYTQELNGSWTLADNFQASTGTLNVVDKFAPAFSVKGYDTDPNNALGYTAEISAGESIGE